MSKQHQTNDKRNYYRNTYLKSEHWRQLRTQKLMQYSTCRICGSESGVDVHHKRYRNLYDVTLHDLVTLCRTHHAMLHKDTKHSHGKFKEMILESRLDLMISVVEGIQNSRSCTRMKPEDWIEIKPGCQRPSNAERVIVADHDAWIQAIYRGGEGFTGFYSTTGACLTPTHWMPIVPPPEPDAYATRAKV